MLIGAFTSALVIGYTLKVLNDASTIYSRKAVPEGVQIADVASLTGREQVPPTEANRDPIEYRVLQLPETPASGPLSRLQPGKYLVDDTGFVRYLVDPGINGALKTRDDGTSVQKYEAPKARLMSLIIDGILTQKLPWGLVLLGVSIALVLELCGIASLPFAVGVYLPLSSSTPIFVGGGAMDSRSLAQGKVEEVTQVLACFFLGLIAGGAIAALRLPSYD